MLAKRIIAELEKLAPLKLSDKWDNSGLQIGNIDSEVTGVLLTIDISMETVKKALENGCNMIISHHPLFFEEVKYLDFKTKRGEMIEKIVKNDILVYSSHSSIDRASMGINNMIKEKLRFVDTSIILNGKEEYTVGYGVVGKILEIKTLKELTYYLKEKLKLDSIRVYENSNNNINKVAFCGGSGSFLIEEANKKDANVLITGDIKHHDAQKAYELGISIIDIGHFKSESFILEYLKEYFISNLEENIKIFLDEKDYFSYYLV